MMAKDMPRTESMERFRGSSDWYPIFARASADASLGEARLFSLPSPAPVTDRLLLAMVMCDLVSKTNSYMRSRATKRCDDCNGCERP
jgi:hypothetical protein